MKRVTVLILAGALAVLLALMVSSPIVGAQTAPDTTIQSWVDRDSADPIDEDGNGTETTTVTYAISNADAAQYSLDSGSWTALGASPASLTLTADGKEHTLSVRAVRTSDGAVDTTPATAKLTMCPQSGCAASPPPPCSTDCLPDLGMAKLGTPYVEKAGDQFRLRFDATIVNVGEGRFEVLGSRNSTSDTTMDTVTQHIFNDTGGYRNVTAQNTSTDPTAPGHGTEAQMVFGGDGHSHWHVKDLETYELKGLDSSNNTRRRTGLKSGFCFYDNAQYLLTLPGAPQSPYYTGCGTSSDLNVTTGLSVGWGDKYGAGLPDQYINITSLPSGRYRLTATADPYDWFPESTGGNNSTYVDLQLQQRQKGSRGYSVTVLGYGPEAKDSLSP